MRGLNSVTHQDSVRVVVNSAAIDMVCLQETKMEVVSRRLILSMLGSDSDNNVTFLTSVGASGGILMAWRTKLGAVGATKIDSFSVSVQFCLDNADPQWLTVVYGPQGIEEKLAFLQELRNIRTQCARPWMLTRDFNMIYTDDDKDNSNLNRALMDHFRRMINDVAMKERHLHGSKFMWISSSTSTTPTLVKLDHVFCSVDWEEYFLGCLLESAATKDLNHCPLILGHNDTHQGKRRFHFASFRPKV